MGWDFTHATHYKKSGKIDKVAEIKSQLGSGYEIVKAYESGATVYAAVKHLSTNEVYALVVLTKTDNDSYFNFGEKWLDEDMGPYYYGCPDSILNLLTPTDSENANEWREKCRLNNENKRKQKNDPDSLSNLPLGSVIEVTFGNGDMFTLIKMPGNGYQFKRDWWKVKGEPTYCPATRIKNYEVIERGVA